jgi:tetratricopeptide (TPR) repeat protein
MAEGHSKDLNLELGHAFQTLAEVQGVPIISNLGQYAQAEQSLIKANTLAELVLASSPNDRKALVLSALVNEDRMILADAGNRRDAVPMFARKSVDRAEAFLKMGALSKDETEVTSKIFGNVALAYKNLHQYDESVRNGRRAAVLGRSGPNGPNFAANALSIVADSLRREGDPQAALNTIDEAFAAVHGYNFPNDELRWSTMHNLLWRRGMILGSDEQISLMRPDDAIVAFQQAFDLIEDIAKRDPDYASSRILFAQDGRELGNILRHGNPVRALAVFDHALSRLREIKNNVKARRGEAQLLADSSYPLRSLKRVGEAQQRIDKAVDLLRQTKDYPKDVISTNDETGTVLRALADQLAETGQIERATGVYQELLAMVLASHPDPEHDLLNASALSRIYEALSHLYLQRNQWEPAKVNSDMRLKIWETWNRKLPNNGYIQKELAAASAT